MISSFLYWNLIIKIYPRDSLGLAPHSPTHSSILACTRVDTSTKTNNNKKSSEYDQRDGCHLTSIIKSCPCG